MSKNDAGKCATCGGAARVVGTWILHDTTPADCHAFVPAAAPSESETTVEIVRWPSGEPLKPPAAAPSESEKHDPRCVCDKGFNPHWHQGTGAFCQQKGCGCAIRKPPAPAQEWHDDHKNMGPNLRKLVEEQEAKDSAPDACDRGTCGHLVCRGRPARNAPPAPRSGEFPSNLTAEHIRLAGEVLGVEKRKGLQPSVYAEHVYLLPHIATAIAEAEERGHEGCFCHTEQIAAFDEAANLLQQAGFTIWGLRFAAHADAMRKKKGGAG